MPFRKGLRLHLQHEFCATCFKAQPGCFSPVNIDDPRIDSVQALHALKHRNGLRLLDLTRPCDSRWFEHDCRMLCLVSQLFYFLIKNAELNGLLVQVCGQTVLDQESRDWTLAAAYVTPMSDREDEVKRISMMRRVAIRNGCRLTSRWNTLVHSRRAF